MNFGTCVRQIPLIRQVRTLLPFSFLFFFHTLLPPPPPPTPRAPTPPLCEEGLVA